MNRVVQYRLLAQLKRQPGRRKLVPLLLLALTGCATGSLDCADLRQGACKVSFQRLFTDTSATFTGPEGLGFTYGSNPNAAATAEAFAAINRLAGLVDRVAAGRLPVPLAPHPPPVAEDGAAWTPQAPLSDWPTTNIYVNRQDQEIAPEYRRLPAFRSCPETGTPHRVTANVPSMVEGVAMAADI